MRRKERRSATVLLSDLMSCVRLQTSALHIYSFTLKGQVEVFYASLLFENVQSEFIINATRRETRDRTGSGSEDVRATEFVF